MVSPYLSRLRAVESAPSLRPRPRSRFEPAPALPIDGPGFAGRVPDPSPAWDTPVTDPEIGVGHEPPKRHPVAVLPAAPGRQKPQPVVPTVPPRSNQDGEVPAPAHAATSAEPPRRSSPAAAAGDGRDAAPEKEPRQVVRPASDLGAALENHAPIRSDAPPPASRRHAAAEHSPHPGGQAVSGAQPPLPAPAPQQDAPTEPPHSPPTPHGTLDPAKRQAQQRQPAATPSAEVEQPHRPAAAPVDRVQAIARWLRDVGPAVPHLAAPTAPSIDPTVSPAPPGRAVSQPAMHTDVTVTIGRIEVKMPGPESPPAQPQPRRPRLRPPSLDDYLAARSRARGRPA